jgi:hypothetical protein
MKRALTTTALLAMAILMASSFAAAQDKPASSFGGEVTIGALGRNDISSSKFQEYREVPKGLSLPYMSLWATTAKLDFNLMVDNVRQTDQRYTGWFNTGAFDLGFDYNQTPHNMGNDSHSVWNETGPGVWSMNSSLRTYYAGILDPLASSARTYPFYDALLAPAFASSNTYDVSSLRQRGTVTLDLSKKLPFDFAFTYMREHKSGYRGEGGGDILGWASPVVDLAEPLNEVTQDFGFRAAYNLKAGSVLKAGNIHGAFNRNLFNNDSETLLIDNPFRPTNLAYAASVPTGSATTLFTTAPDNEASTGSVGFQLKFARQTRIAGDFAMASWTQNAAFYPMTLNPLIVNGSGQPTNVTSSYPATSLNGKISTDTTNVYFSTRPINNLGVRVQYRKYGYKDKSARFVIAGDTSGSPDNRWQAAAAPTADEPYGHATANRTDADTSYFTVQANYDIKALTVEGAYKNASSSWVGRVGSSGDAGKEKTYTLALLYHASDMLGIRLMNDWANRTVSGLVAGSQAAVQGVMEDHAERDLTRTGFDVELTPNDKFDVTFTYFRNNAEYTNRPAKGIDDPTAFSGLLSAKYDSFTGEVGFHPNAKLELDAYYTYETNKQTNQWIGLTSNTYVNNKLNYAGSDKTNTFGLNFVYNIVPDKCSLRLLARQQKVDGLMDITAKETLATGATSNFYYPGRTTLIATGQGGAADVTDWDDTKITTFGIQLDYAIAKAWKLAGGYAYEKYTYADAYTAGTTQFPFSIMFAGKADNGAYEANVAYTTLTYRF